MSYLKCLTLADVVDAVVAGHYRVAGSISLNLVRNKLTAANSVRRSKWYFR